MSRSDCFFAPYDDEYERRTADNSLAVCWIMNAEFCEPLAEEVYISSPEDCEAGVSQPGALNTQYIGLAGTSYGPHWRSLLLACHRGQFELDSYTSFNNLPVVQSSLQLFFRP